MNNFKRSINITNWLHYLRQHSDNHKIVINADKMPSGQQASSFNAPKIDKVAIVIVGENLENRNIVLHRRKNHLQHMDFMTKIGIIFQWRWYIQLEVQKTSKKFSSMNYYSNRLMVREHEDNYNYILKCRCLFQQYFQVAYLFHMLLRLSCFLKSFLSELGLLAKHYKKVDIKNSSIPLL